MKKLYLLSIVLALASCGCINAAAGGPVAAEQSGEEQHQNNKAWLQSIINAFDDNINEERLLQIFKENEKPLDIIREVQNRIISIGSDPLIDNEERVLAGRAWKLVGAAGSRILFGN